MEFFDCNVSYGIDVSRKYLFPACTLENLKEELRRAGISKALVYRAEQKLAGTVTGNNLLSEDIARENNLFGLWSILPVHTGEIPGPDIMPRLMKENNIIGWKLFPSNARFIPDAYVLKEWFELASERDIPIFINTSDGIGIEQLCSILDKYGSLTVILTYANAWPSDRILRPVLERFPNLYLDISYYFIEGALESFVKEYGSARLLYGSGFPHMYFGANMLMLKHANIPENDKVSIAGQNLSRLIRRIKL